MTTRYGLVALVSLALPSAAGAQDTPGPTEPAAREDTVMTDRMERGLENLRKIDGEAGERVIES